MVGAHLDKHGAAVKDFIGRPTGAVFLESQPEAKELLRFMHFCVLDGMASGSSASFPVVGQREHLQGASFDECVENFLSFSRRIGAIKRIAVEHAGVGRHSGTLSNFLYISHRDRLLITDTDSCLQIDRDLREELRGPQLLRDLASDTFKNMCSLTFYGFSGRFLHGVEAKKINPLSPILEGFFQGDVPKRSIKECTSKLLGAYTDFVECHHEQLKDLAWARVTSRYTAHLNDWLRIHTSLLAPILEGSYELIKKSRLADNKYIVPDMDLPTRRTKFETGARAFLAAYRNY